MKTITKKYLATTSTLLMTAFLLQSCSSSKINITEETRRLHKKKAYSKSSRATPPAGIPFRGYNKFSIDSTESLPPRFENFDNKPYPKDSFAIANMIAVVQPELDEESRDNIANKLSLAIKKYNIEPQIFISIIDTESNFNSDKISHTGDLSMAQINVEMWNREFKRMNLPLMDKEKIQSDLDYSFQKMAEILNIIKIRHEKEDRTWYARYHSGTPKLKDDYLKKLTVRLKMMASSETLNNQIAQVKNIELLAATKFSDEKTKTIQSNNFINSVLAPLPLASNDHELANSNKEVGPITEIAKNILQNVLRF